MNFLIVTSAPIIIKGSSKYAYGPYVDEIEIWKSANPSLEISFACPLWKNQKNLLVKEIPFKTNEIYELKDFNLKTPKAILSALIKSISNLVIIYKAMTQADHIHLRCPGNMGLLGCMVQMLFPKTPKTAKYAGNWDPKARQPWSYKLQRYILRNPFLTRNMQVLVYGDWPDQTKNIKSFFTASYFEKEKSPIKTRHYTQPIHFCFVGSLVKGKQPLKALELVDKIKQSGVNTNLHIYGEGPERKAIENQIQKRELEESVVLHGNQPKGKIKQALQDYHFLILPSQSEGWPKVVAEAMFWGCIPMVTPISCVPWMLDDGKRGILMHENSTEKTAEQLMHLLKTPELLEDMARRAATWSRFYTLDRFEGELKKVLEYREN